MFSFKSGLPPPNCPSRNAKEIGNGLKPFNPADNLAGRQRRAHFEVEAMIDNFTQHPGGELGQPDPPQPFVLTGDPGMRRTVEASHRQCVAKCDRL